MLSLSKHRWLTAVVALIIAGSLAGCGDRDSAAPSSTETPVPPTATVALPTNVPPSSTGALEPTTTPSVIIEPTDVPSTSPAQVISRGPADSNSVVFTFDAGSDTGFTAQILDTLSANEIVAAFGITGRWAEQNPALLERIVNEGHELINHTYDHGSFTGYSTSAPGLMRSQRFDQLNRAEAIFQNIAGTSALPYFRPPYGDYDASVNVDVGALGYRYNVMWTVDSMGWNGYTADQIVQRCLDQAVSGAIYIFHVGSQSQDGPVLQRVIDGLRSAGYEFVPLSTFAP